MRLRTGVDALEKRKIPCPLFHIYIYIYISVLNATIAATNSKNLDAYYEIIHSANDTSNNFKLITQSVIHVYVCI